MSDTNQLLEVLQADVYGMLKATPALALANVIVDNEGDIEAKVTKALSTLTPTGGKNGLAVVVLLPEVTEGEKNLPGPPLTVKIEIRTLENVLLNRAAATGSLMRSSQAALTVLSVLQQTRLGHCLLYCEKDPVAPVEVKKGHVSHAVTLFAKFSGFVTARPLAVRDEMLFQGASAQVTGELRDTTQTPITFPLLPLVGTGPDGGDAYQEYLTDAVAGIYWEAATEAWILYFSGYDGIYGRWNASGTVESPLEALVWTHDTNETGTPALTLVASGSALQLTCATPASTIRYTTDGSFPSPDKTLYTGPITGLSGGMLVRSAAYVAGMPPSDVLNTLLAE